LFIVEPRSVEYACEQGVESSDDGATIASSSADRGFARHSAAAFDYRESPGASPARLPGHAARRAGRAAM
jgi:hypothetical protein